MKQNLRKTEFTKKRYNATSGIYNLLEWPIEQLWYKKWRQNLWQQIEGPKVLEIGVGTGKNIPYYPDDIELAGIDLSPKMLQRAKQLLATHQKSNVTLKEMDAQQLEFPDDTFDEVVATFVFCSVPNPVLGLWEARRVAKPGGKLYLLEHMRSKNKRFATIMKNLDNPIHYLSGVHIARKTVKNIEKAGWAIDDVEELTSNGIFRKIKAHKV